MNYLLNLPLGIEINPQIAAALIGILSMVVARLLDWYFPSKYHRRLDDDEVEENEEKPRTRRKRVKRSTEENNDDVY